jgi:sugar phosphate isomerase/epimerase
MKVSLRVNFRGADPVNPLDGVLQDAKKIGFDAIELMLDPDEPLKPGWKGPWSSQDVSAEMREGFRKSSEKHGIEIGSFSTDWAWAYSQFCPRLDQWDRGVELIKSDLELARDLGAKVILMHVGHSKGSWEQVKSIVSQAAEFGGKVGVKVGFEGNIFARIGLGGLEALIKLVDEVDNPWFGVYGHCSWPRGTMRDHEEIALIGNRLLCMHSSALDFRVDYEKKFQALKAVGYDGYWVFEVEPDWGLARKNHAELRYLLERYG